MEGVEVAPGVLDVVEGRRDLAHRLDGLVGDPVGPAVLGGGLVVHAPRFTDRHRPAPPAIGASTRLRSALDARRPVRLTDRFAREEPRWRPS